MSEDKIATPIKVNVNKKYIWSSGELGIVIISKDEEVVNLTIEQAKSLIRVIQTKLAYE